MPLLLVATSVAVCSLSANVSCGSDFPNPVVNGEFSTGDLTGWTLNCPDGGCSIEPDPWWNGNSFRWTPLSSLPATLTQPLTLKHGLHALDFHVRDSSILFNPDRNTLDIQAGQRTLQLYFYESGFGRTEIFPADAGPSDLSFTFTASNGIGSVFFDSVVVLQLDDGGAAQSTAVALQASQLGMRQFADAIFTNTGAKAAKLAAHIVPTMVAGPSMARTAGARAWASGGYSQSAWDSFDTRIRGGIFHGGIEYVVGSEWTAGFAVAYADQITRASGDISSIDGDGRSATLALYGRHEPNGDPMYATAALGGGVSTRDQSRTSNVAFETYTADGIDGSHWFAAIESGYRVPLDATLSLTPFVRLSGGQSREDGYQEAATWYFVGGVVVAPTSQDSLASEIGLRTLLPQIFDEDIDAQLRLSWRHEFLDPNGVDYTIDEIGRNRFAMTLPGVDAGRDSAVFGAMLDAAIWDRTSLFVRYDGEYGSGFDRHSGQAGVRAVW